MEYRFGPNKPRFTGTDDEWNKLKQKIAWWNEDTSHYPSVTVICPHCGTKNTHTNKEQDVATHRECHLMRDRKGKKVYYDCPGYLLSRYINPS